MIRLARPPIDEEALDAVREVLLSGQLVQGERVATFEEALAERVGRAHAVAVNSGTSALHLALLALGTGPGDLVVTTAYSYTATANVVELCGAEPVFVDIEPETFNLDPEALAEVLHRLDDDGHIGRVRALLPVHAFGHMAEMPRIVELAERYRVPVVEDAACALGAARDGRAAGTWGKLGCFSFHPRKAITTGEGGAVVTGEPELARKLRALRNHGQDPDAPGPDFILPGFNLRMTEFQAALGLSQLPRLTSLIERRRRLAARYDRLLQDTDVRPPAVAPGCDHVFQSYVVLLPEAIPARRDALIQAMKERGVETSIGTWHMPLTGWFAGHYGHGEGDFPVTDGIFARSLALPLHDGLDDDDQRRVARSLQGVLREAGAPT